MSRLRVRIFCALVWAGTALLAACNPTLNWREVRQPDSALLALMPCKPEASSRNVSLGGQDVRMQLNNCTADGASFIVGSANVQKADAALALSHWKQAVLANIAAPLAGQTVKVTDIRVSGVASPQQLVAGKGKRSDGSGVQFTGLWFVHGTHVFHAAIYADKLGTEMSEPFFNGLKLQ